jgi:hypothetical protein
VGTVGSGGAAAPDCCTTGALVTADASPETAPELGYPAELAPLFVDDSVYALLCTGTRCWLSTRCVITTAWPATCRVEAEEAARVGVARVGVATGAGDRGTGGAARSGGAFSSGNLASGTDTAGSCVGTVADGASIPSTDPASTTAYGSERAMIPSTPNQKRCRRVPSPLSPRVFEPMRPTPAPANAGTTLRPMHPSFVQAITPQAASNGSVSCASFLNRRGPRPFSPSLQGEALIVVGGKLTHQHGGTSFDLSHTHGSGACGWRATPSCSAASCHGLAAGAAVTAGGAVARMKRSSAATTAAASSAEAVGATILSLGRRFTRSRVPFDRWQQIDLTLNLSLSPMSISVRRPREGIVPI